jgi:hypothetical protein
MFNAYLQRIGHRRPSLEDVQTQVDLLVVIREGVERLRLVDQHQPVAEGRCAKKRLSDERRDLDEQLNRVMEEKRRRIELEEDDKKRKVEEMQRRVEQRLQEEGDMLDLERRRQEIEEATRVEMQRRFEAEKEARDRENVATARALRRQTLAISYDELPSAVTARNLRRETIEPVATDTPRARPTYHVHKTPMTHFYIRLDPTKYPDSVPPPLISKRVKAAKPSAVERRKNVTRKGRWVVEDMQQSAL